MVIAAPVEAEFNYEIRSKIGLEQFQKTFFEKGKINYFGGIAVLQENRHLLSGELERIYEELLRQEYSYFNQHSIVYNDKKLSVIPNPEPTFRDATDDVLDEIIGKHRIVILNEKHHYPIHRGFAEILLLALQRKGFRHLAAETFTENVKSPDLRYPTIYLGNYSREPMFGHFIRRALSAGFKLIHYEHHGEGTDVSSRELGQAKNLVERFFSKTSDQEKLFVYVGYSHVREKQNASTHVWMAQKLKELTASTHLQSTRSGSDNPTLSIRSVLPWLKVISGNPREMKVPQTFILPIQNMDPSWIVKSQKGSIEPVLTMSLMSSPLHMSLSYMRQMNTKNQTERLYPSIST